jgi:hypothetical protein
MPVALCFSLGVLPSSNLLTAVFSGALIRPAELNS